MDCKELIEHILGNAKAYIEDYSTKEKLEENEKGILQGLWMDVDSIKNHIDSVIIMDEESAKEARKLKNELNLEKIIKELEELIYKTE